MLQNLCVRGLSQSPYKFPVFLCRNCGNLSLADDTQFWVCPNCGKDTQYKNGKQYCDSCKAYL